MFDNARKKKPETAFSGWTDMSEVQCFHQFFDCLHHQREEKRRRRRSKRKKKETQEKKERKIEEEKK